ncbi:MAG: hypothetical protein KGZ67_02310 [Hydrogenophaga sp.]|nr:hypothetical protein [Hydrogenophaga sp.]
MKTLVRPLALIAIAITTSVASAQYVKGNEAVRLMPNGTTAVDVPPLPRVSLGAPCPAAKPGCAAGGWKMLESTDGLVECTEVFGRPTTCRPSTFGTEKRSRVWIVKVKGTWMQCAEPTISNRCVSLMKLPVSAVQ